MDVVKTAHFSRGMDRPVARRFWSGRRLTYAAAGAAAIAALAVLLLVLGPADRTLRVEASKITVATVAAAPFHDFIPLRGQVVPLETVYLDVGQGGRVEEVLAEAGQHVTAGQPLLRFSDANLELDAIARETQVIEQINTQRQLELQFEQTRTGDAHAIADADYNIIRLGREVARRQPLATKGFTSQETLDQSADELAYQKRLREIAGDAQTRDTKLIDQSEGLIKETAARLDANLAAAKRLLEAMTVKAPVDGVLTAFDAHVGEEKARGIRLGQIDQANGFKVTVDVDEFYLARVQPGQHVDVTVDDKPAKLVVSKVYPQVKDGKFEVDLAWDGAVPEGLRRGEAVQGRLELGGDTRSVVLPAGAFLEVSGGAWVFVVDGSGGEAERRTVKLGRRTPEAVEVLEGLKPGDRVVTSDYSGLDRIDRLVIER
ncbi:MAG TPA: efflux RND transporter periplasmic adaptor subunit [Stellaceae bacterium]|nr:efflux RND transporter periplasmic adaptor subunit [Stellaceae bacterium]